MQSLLPTINKIQEILASHSIDQAVSLPQIIVVGSQSAGKSSVMESIVGHDFLPRGQGIVTRRPLIIQLHNGQNEYGEFAHKKDKKIYDYAEIKSEIENETNKIAGISKDVSRVPILLKLYSKDYLDLTLVDLPGLTRVPIGNQPKDIEYKIREMILEYIKDENCLILAVTAANADLATSDSLQLAKEVDPNKERTIGVLTKLDLMDKDTNAVEILTNKVYELKLGFIGIVCRSQKDINENKPLSDHIQSETAFYENNGYSKIQERCGTPALVKRLSSKLIEHINIRMPYLKSKLSEMQYVNRKLLNELGEPISSTDKPRIILEIINRYCNKFSDILNGKQSASNTSELQGGSRIRYIFNSLYLTSLNKTEDVADMKDEEMRILIRNTQGLKPIIFLPEMSYSLLIKRLIKRVSPLAVECLNAVYHELISIISKHALPDFNRFKRFGGIITEKMIEFINKLKPLADRMISNIMDIEDAYINTDHPDFADIVKKVLDSYKDGVVEKREDRKEEKKEEKKDKIKEKVQDKNKKLDDIIPFELQGDKKIKDLQLPPIPNSIVPSDYSDKESIEIHMIREFVAGYFYIMKKKLGDIIPKTIMCFLVNKAAEEASNYLVSELYKEDMYNNLLDEDPLISKERDRVARLVTALNESMAELNKIDLHD